MRWAAFFCLFAPMAVAENSASPVDGATSIPVPLSGGAWIGDAGHFANAPVYLLNPTDGDFTVTVHRYNWVFEGGWNNPRIRVKIDGPGGDEVLNSTIETNEEGATLEVNGGKKGVYRVEVFSNGLNYWHLTTSLPSAVSAQEESTPGRADDGETWFRFSPMVPRTWYFFVPEGTGYFSLKVQSNTSRSQREDHGLTIRSPRGQRMAAMLDQPNPGVQDGKIVSGRELFLTEEVHVIVDPGSDGQFWSLEVEMGDAHVWSGFEFALSGVPPYLAQAPEMWFDPKSGETAPLRIYVEEPFDRKNLPPDEERQRPYMRYWMAAPGLGDNASNQLGTPARIALWNPEGRELELVLRDYVERDPKETNSAVVRLSGADGKQLEEWTTPPVTTTEPFKQILNFQGVRFLDVEQIDRFWLYTYPATPVVLVGGEVDDRWHRFRMEAGTRRHWFFKVPDGTASFEVRVQARYPHDVVDMEIHAPDRMVGRIFGKEGTTNIHVPAGLAGKIWYFSIGVGGSTRYFPTDRQPRSLVIPLNLDLKGVPPFLAPTRAQWFHPGELP